MLAELWKRACSVDARCVGSPPSRDPRPRSRDWIRVASRPADPRIGSLIPLSAESTISPHILRCFRQSRTAQTGRTWRSRMAARSVAGAATVAAYRDAARKNDILIAEVGAWSNPMAADADEAAAARATYIAALDLAERIGARCAVNITGSRGAKWDGPDPADLTPETFDLIVETTRAIVDAVKPTRARYALETMPWMYPYSPDSYLALLKAIDRRETAVHFDPVNLVNSPARYFPTGDLIRGFVSRLGDRIVSVHCKDIILRKRLTVHLDECRPGTGALDYPALLRALHDLGDADLPLLLEHLPYAYYRLAAAHIRAQAQALGYDIADQPTAPAPAVNDGPFLRSAGAVEKRGVECYTDNACGLGQRLTRS